MDPLIKEKGECSEMNKCFSAICLAAVVLFVKLGSCEENSPPKGLFSGYASGQAGEVMNGRGIGTISGLDHRWLQTGYAGLMADAAVSDHFHVLAALEGELDFSFGVNPGAVDMYRQTEMPRTILNIKHAEGIYSFENPQQPFLQFEGGLFPYKYNPDARNLGEYLFRSFPYPQYIINVFDRPYTDMAGLRIGNRVGTGFHQDLLFTSEIHNFPLMDFSLSYCAGYNLAKVIEVSAGTDFDRLFPVNNMFTTPQGENLTANHYYTPSGDSGFYTFSGIKTMARVSFDPKIFLPGNFFGNEDLKVYSEIAILGLKNYPVDTNRSTAYYSKLSERMPIMVGFNFPVCAPALSRLIGFKLLDLANGEIEYFPNRFPNSFDRTFSDYLPLPTNEDQANKHDNLRWSTYVKRDCGKNCSVIVQIAHDHLIPETFTLAQGQTDRTDVLLRHGDWWWVAKTQFTF
jgi:hypothetical protein